MARRPAARIPFHRQQVLRGKRLLSLREMLASFCTLILGLLQALVRASASPVTFVWPATSTSRRKRT